MSDPSTLKRYSVIRVHFEYKGEEPGLKRFVVLWHQKISDKQVVVCVKTTSKVDRYLNDVDLFNGCVYYPAGELKIFGEPTVIQPENGLALPYDYLRKHGFEILGDLPEDFEQEFLEAVEQSITLTPIRKETMKSNLGKPS